MKKHNLLKGSLLAAAMIFGASGAMAFTSTGNFTVDITVQPSVTVTTNNVTLTEVTPGTPSAGFSGAANLDITAPTGVAYTVDFTSLNAGGPTTRALSDSNLPANADLAYNIEETANPGVTLGTDVSGFTVTRTGNNAVQTIALTAVVAAGNYGVWSDTITATVTY